MEDWETIAMTASFLSTIFGPIPHPKSTLSLPLRLMLDTIPESVFVDIRAFSR